MTSPSTSARLLRVSGLVVLAVLAFALATPAQAQPAATLAQRGDAPSAARAGQTPDIVIILTDDQPTGLVDAMPTVASQIRGRGVDLVNGLIPTSTCCPSRSSLLTGNYSHTTGVYTNHAGRFGGWPTFNSGGAEQTTLATELNAAGYRTALFGKYLNGWSRYHPRGFVPPGWDQFAATGADNGGDTAYYNYTLTGTKPDEHFGSTAADYSTDVLADKAVRYINATPSGKPLFLYFAPTGPHSPYVPAPRHKGTWPLEPTWTIPAFNEADMSDKPRWLRKAPLLDPLRQRKVLTRQHEAVMSVDDAVRRMLKALGPRADNTLFVFMSDNGLMTGSHRRTGKDLPHRRSTEVPMYLRWDGVLPAGVKDARPTTNTDITATIAEAAGLTWPMEGTSYLSTTRTGTVLEQTKNEGHPAYCGWRSKRYLFVEYDSGKGRELYDYRKDPEELKNAIADPAYSRVIRRLRNQAQAACSPVPPGFSWR